MVGFKDFNDGDTFFVTVKSASYLDETADAYVVVKYERGRQVKQTKSIRSSNPHWEETFEFQYNKSHKTVKFEMYDKQEAEKELVGKVEATLSAVEGADSTKFSLTCGKAKEEGVKDPKIKIVLSLGSPPPQKPPSSKQRTQHGAVDDKTTNNQPATNNNNNNNPRSPYATADPEDPPQRGGSGAPPPSSNPNEEMRRTQSREVEREQARERERTREREREQRERREEERVRKLPLRDPRAGMVRDRPPEGAVVLEPTEVHRLLLLANQRRLPAVATQELSAPSHAQKNPKKWEVADFTSDESSETSSDDFSDSSADVAVDSGVKNSNHSAAMRKALEIIRRGEAEVPDSGPYGQGPPRGGYQRLTPRRGPAPYGATPPQSPYNQSPHSPMYPPQHPGQMMYSPGGRNVFPPPPPTSPYAAGMYGSPDRRVGGYNPQHQWSPSAYAPNDYYGMRPVHTHPRRVPYNDGSLYEKDPYMEEMEREIGRRGAHIPLRVAGTLDRDAYYIRSSSEYGSGPAHHNDDRPADVSGRKAARDLDAYYGNTGSGGYGGGGDTYPNNNNNNSLERSRVGGGGGGVNQSAHFAVKSPLQDLPGHEFDD